MLLLVKMIFLWILAMHLLGVRSEPDVSFVILHHQQKQKKTKEEIKEENNKSKQKGEGVFESLPGCII